jgi:hypothetical protein
MEGEWRKVQFFPNAIVDVLLTSVRDRNLPAHLEEIGSRSPITLDLEWCAFNRRSFPSVYQMCSSDNRVLVIRDLDRQQNTTLRRFLMSNRFVGKGIQNDLQKLGRRYGRNFEICIEDIEVTRLGPYGESMNFDLMVQRFVGDPCAEIKQREVALSNWEAPVLSIQQVVYAAFDAYALFRALERMPPPKYYPLRSSLPVDQVGLRFKEALMKSLYTRRGCRVCGRRVKNPLEHCWDTHADSLCELFAFGADIPAAVREVTVSQGGKLLMEHPDGSVTKHKSFRGFRLTRRVDPPGIFPVVETLYEYLVNTGRLPIEGGWCALCNCSKQNIQRHVWAKHAGFLEEWLV